MALLDYAHNKNISLSTLRRRIKANKIQHRLEHGRYLIWDENPGLSAMQPSTASAPSHSEQQLNSEAADETVMLYATLSEMETRLQKASEEIVELRTLIALYEDQISRFQNLQSFGPGSPRHV